MSLDRKNCKKKWIARCVERLYNSIQCPFYIVQTESACALGIRQFRTITILLYNFFLCIKMLTFSIDTEKGVTMKILTLYVWLFHGWWVYLYPMAGIVCGGVW